MPEISHMPLSPFVSMPTDFSSCFGEIKYQIQGHHRFACVNKYFTGSLGFIIYWRNDEIL